MYYSYLQRRHDHRAVFFLFSFILVASASVVFISTHLAHAHFNLNVNIRIIHISHETDGLRLFVRLPMAYLVADKLGSEKADGSREPAPFTNNREENGALVHYLDVDALRDNPAGLGQIVVDGHKLLAAGEVLEGRLVGLRAYPALKQVPFARLEEAREALKGDVYNEDFEITYVGDTVIDAEIFYPTQKTVRGYSLESTLNPDLPLQEETANLILDHQDGNTLTFRVRGLLSEPVSISRSWLKAFSTFVVEGIKHILEGLDHVLFVLCLVLGARELAGLLWRVTGFTVGHSITLSLGFFGYVPDGPWFVPFVEAAIALSIIYAAIIAMSDKRQSQSFIATTIIGLLHGLGFSFVLGEILQLDSSNLWQSLLAFNVGVEIGQVFIILASWPLLWYAAGKYPVFATRARTSLIVAFIAVASVWAGQRSLLLIQAL